tara:strand:- start:361 stop:537 length:177 start_codon:yes stop_codon:yes gene_type:complete
MGIYRTHKGVVMTIDVSHLNNLEVPEEALDILRPYSKDDDEAKLVFKKMYVLFKDDKA